MLFELITSHDINHPIQFNPDTAVAFICEKIYDYGYSDEWFDNYDSYRSDLDYYSKDKIERIGKKYQWIAFYELIARVSDNFKWIPRGFDDLTDNTFYSLMQINQRKFEATLWSEIIFQNKKSENESISELWKLSKINYCESATITMKEWACDKTIVPEFEKLVEQIYDNKKWTILYGFSSNRQNHNKHDTEIWCRIDGVIVKSDQTDGFIKSVIQLNLEDGSNFDKTCFTDELFYGEYCWHDYLNMLEKSRPENQWRVEGFKQDIHIPLYEYEWEDSIGDYSLNANIFTLLPSPLIINEFELSNSPTQIGKWFDKNGEIVFMQPDLLDSHNHYAMIDYNRFKKWLDDNGLALIWIIGGEKQIFLSNHDGLVKRTVFNCVLTEDHGQIKRKHFSFNEPILFNTVDGDLTDSNL